MRRTYTLLIGLVLIGGAVAADPPAPPKGQRLFSAGHSFHMFVPGILKEIATSAGIKDHTQVGTQGIGGSRVIQHWDLADDKNKVKPAIKEGKVDVLTLSPIFLPDEGIDHLTKLALEHNPNVRILVQANWLPYDVLDVNYQKKKPPKVDRNSRTAEQLRKAHGEYQRTIADQVASLNKRHGKQVVLVVPIGQAAILLREKIIDGKAPGLKEQNDLFTDEIGHAKPPLQLLNAYCHYAVIYGKNPVGLPVPSVLKNAKNPEWDDKLNRLLQELAWRSVTSEPLTGVKLPADR